MNNIAALAHWIECSYLDEFVVEDEETAVLLRHPESGKEFWVVSYGLGDFYTHGIDVVLPDNAA